MRVHHVLNLGVLFAVLASSYSALDCYIAEPRPLIIKPTHEPDAPISHKFLGFGRHSCCVMPDRGGPPGTVDDTCLKGTTITIGNALMDSWSTGQCFDSIWRVACMQG
jgi:hypothetical protein